MTRTGATEVARRRRGNAVNGWLIVDKPAGITSAQVVSRVRRAAVAAKAGHGGTLDPLATGILPVAFGEATKTISYVVDGAKLYRFTVKWGEQRNTDDAEGEVTAVSGVRPTAAEIRGVLDRFTRRNRAGSADLLGDQDFGEARVRACPRRVFRGIAGSAGTRRSHRAGRLSGPRLRRL